MTFSEDQEILEGSSWKKMLLRKCIPLALFDYTGMKEANIRRHTSGKETQTMAGRMPKYDAILSEVLPDKAGFREVARGAVWESDGTNPRAPEINGKLFTETEKDAEGRTQPKAGSKIYSISLFDISRRQKAGT